jgi:hypothetical protein
VALTDKSGGGRSFLSFLAAVFPKVEIVFKNNNLMPIFVINDKNRPQKWPVKHRFFHSAIRPSILRGNAGPALEPRR